MLTKKERMEKLAQEGIEIGRYFTFEVPEGLAPNTKIHLVIDESGVPKFETENDPILSQIIEDGYVRNTKLFRRFVCAQMFNMLNYVSYDGQHKGYNACLKRMYSYDYTIKMMTEEVRVLSKLEEKDRESFEERVHFFNRTTITAVLEDYIKELEKYVDKLPEKKCKGVPYKRVKQTNIFVADFDKKLYNPVKSYIRRIACADNFKVIYKILCEFNRTMVKLPWDTRKSPAWIDAYKGSGAYFTIKNLVLFNGCNLFVDNGVYTDSTMKTYYLKEKLNEYQGEGWRMFALMNKVIKDNNFDFNKRMREVYGREDN